MQTSGRSVEIETHTNLNRMAREGRRFTNFYVSQAVCSAPARAFSLGATTFVSVFLER